MTLIFPVVIAILVGLVLRRAGQQFARELVVEQGRRLTNMVVGADEQHIVHLH